MCHACVTDAVKNRMLSRRNFLKAAPVAAAAATITAAPAALAAGHSQVVDMTHTLSDAFPTYFGVPGFAAKKTFNFKEHGFNLFELSVNEHTGTHLDAPIHFSADGQTVDEIPIDNLVCPLCVIHIHERAADNADTSVTPDDIKAWIAKHGPIPDGACVAMHSGWEARVTTGNFRNPDGEGTMHFPGFHLEAAKMLMEETGAVGMAVDSLSLDVGTSTTYDTHYAWLPSNRWGLECIANLAKVPAAGATLVVGAPKHLGGSGGPSRVIALV